MRIGIFSVISSPVTLSLRFSNRKLTLHFSFIIRVFLSYYYTQIYTHKIKKRNKTEKNLKRLTYLLQMVLSIQKNSLKPLKTHFVTLAGIEPTAKEPESFILSIKLQGHKRHKSIKLSLSFILFNIKTEKIIPIYIFHQQI